MKESEVTLTDSEIDDTAEEVVTVVETDEPAANDEQGVAAAEPAAIQNLDFLDDEVESGDEVPEVLEADAVSEPVDMAEMFDDKDKSVNGVFATYRGKTRVKVARAGNEKYQAYLARQYTAHRAIIDAGGSQSDAMSKRIYVEAAAKCLVLDWENMNFGGQDIAYSAKAALYFLTNSDDFKAWVDKQSNKNEDYHKTCKDEDIESAKKLLSGK